MAASSAHTLRREADLARLRELCAQAGGRVEIVDDGGRPGRPIRLEIRCRTAASEDYPRVEQSGVRLRIDLPSRYPFERPVVTVESRIFHPNVFASGVVCQGEKWLPAEGLDLLLKRMIRLVTFDPAHVNPASAANRAAAAWYLQQRSRTPDAFPTDRFDFAAAVNAANAANAAPGERVVRRCPACGKGLRLPVGRQGRVACPGCRHEFDVST
jgi:hypothetical protein